MFTELVLALCTLALLAVCLTTDRLPGFIRVLLYGQPATTFFALLCAQYRPVWLTNAFMAQVLSLLLISLAVAWHGYNRERSADDARRLTRQFIRYMVAAFIAIVLVLIAGRKYHYQPEKPPQPATGDTLYVAPSAQESADQKKWNEL